MTIALWLCRLQGDVTLMLSPRRIITAVAVLASLLFGILSCTVPLPAGAASLSSVCVQNDLLSIADRGTAGTNPCSVAKHALLLETGYYQNASALGGTQQAAYPLADLRYGLSNRTEIFLDPAARIAKSGLNGLGIYTWSRSGGGIKHELIVRRNTVLAVHAEYTPQSDETASLSTRERYDMGLNDRWSLTPTFSISASVGDIAYTQQTLKKNQQSSLYLRTALRERLSPAFAATVLIGRDSKIALDARPQTSIGLSLSDRLSPNCLGDADIGTALNGTGNTKAHYIGFGIAVLH